MVAKINTACKLKKIFNYNEIKVGENLAKCIAASGYPKDLENLSLSNKLNLLLHQAALRRGMKKPGVHVSLNFHPSENYPAEKLAQIAADYMEGIGFKDQPYLVYEHKDTDHQHLHIVTLKVKTDGGYLNTNRIGEGKSEATRLRLEKKYNLVPAQDSEKKSPHKVRAINIQALKSGKIKIHGSITGVLNEVLDHYRYTSIHELNAVLQLHNVRAERGSETSRTYQHGGLLYQVIDEQGKKVGKPVKASNFENKATLVHLKERFNQNQKGREKDKRELRVAIDTALLNKNINSIASFCSVMHEKGIDVVLRKNDAGRIYGITFVDHPNGNVFNGRPLGKNYTAAAIINRCNANVNNRSFKTPKKLASPGQINPQIHPSQSFTGPIQFDTDHDERSFAELLLQPEFTSDQLPYHLRLNRKKKRRKRHGPNGTK